MRHQRDALVAWLIDAHSGRPRVANAHNEAGALDVALATTGAQLERICCRLRRATDIELEMAESRTFRGRVLGSGLVKLEIVLTADEADLVAQAVDQLPSRPPRPPLDSRRPHGAREPRAPLQLPLSTGPRGWLRVFADRHRGGPGPRA